MTLPEPPGENRNLPPPPGAEHVADVLERRKKWSWKNFGGDGFLVSVAFHLILAVVAVFYIVSRYKAPVLKVDPDVFATGAGGGAHGDKPKAFEQKLQTRRTTVKMPVRITSKSAGAVLLPEAPQTSVASFSSGLASGGMSKGFGGGTGGGEGPGIGVGKGGGKNFVSAFGSKGWADNRLVGSIYDFYRTQTGARSGYPQRGTGKRVNNMDWMVPLVTAFIEEGWREEKLSSVFKGPVSLSITRVLVPYSSDSAAPQAFETDGKMTGGAWIAVYRGRVTAPETAMIRFLGNADNFIAVRLNKKTVLNFSCGKKPSETFRERDMHFPTARGGWIQVNKGTTYDMAILIGDAGGVFNAWLGYEKKDRPGNRFLFHTEKADVLQGKDIPQNFDPASPVWLCKAPAARSIR